MSAVLISLAGPPASGKTTVAGWLAATLGGKLVLEDYAGNPFLAESYGGRDDLRLAGQTWFLLSRTHQLGLPHWPIGGAVVSDYAFLQDGVYAHVWLGGSELASYERLFAQLAPRVHPPDLIIHLDGPDELLLERIARRGRDFERRFSADFLGKLRAGYNAVLPSAGCPVVAVDVACRDLRRDDQQQWLLDRVREALPHWAGRAQGLATPSRARQG